MIKRISHAKFWIAISMFSVQSLFAQNSQQSKSFTNQGHEQIFSRMVPAYKPSARVEVKGSWDLYTTGSFLYWQARQENMELGFISQNDPLITGLHDTPFGTSYPNHITFVTPHFTYRPGFKVGLGANLDWDQWNAFAEYTWFHSTIETGVNPLSPATTDVPLPNGKYLYPEQGHPQIGNPNFFQSANQSWNLKMDFIDLTLARCFYSGKRISMNPFFGARGAWIRQIMNTFYNGSTTTYNVNGIPSALGMLRIESENSSISWGVGPCAGFDTNWLIGYGLKFIGNASADILYTRYDLRLLETAQNLQKGSSSPLVENARVSQTTDFIRTHADLELGFGWGSYFFSNAYYVDLSATYGYQVFWNQNMFRNYVTGDMPAKGINPNGNLYVHGMTLNARLDF